MRNRVLDQLDLNRKPVRWSEIERLEGLTEEVRNAIAKLPVLYVDFRYRPTDSRVTTGLPDGQTWFVAEVRWQVAQPVRFLVNTEGYEYARYAARLPK